MRPPARLSQGYAPTPLSRLTRNVTNVTMTYNRQRYDVDAVVCARVVSSTQGGEYVMARAPVKGPVVIPNCAEVRLMFSINSINFSNVLHCQLVPTGPIDPAVATSIFSGIKARAESTAWFGHLHPSLSFNAVTVKDLRAANNAAYTSTGTAMVGTGTGTPLSQGSAMVVTLRTARSGRGFVGRVYLGGMDSSVLATARTFNSAQLTQGVNFVTGINAVIGPLLGSLVVAQRALGADPTSDNPAMQQPRAATTVPVTAINSADNRVDSQRNRLG